MSEKKTKTEKKGEFDKLTISEARIELQKIHMSVQEGKESDTSKIKKLKKHIARLLTQKDK